MRGVYNKKVDLDINAKYWFIVLIIITITAIILFSMGRVPWYKYGQPQLWSGNINSDQNSQQLADPYTFTHIIHGFIIYIGLWLIFGKKLPLGTRLIIAIGLEAGWEIFENTDLVINRYRESTISLDYYGDSILNSIGDIIACIFGFIIATKTSVRTTIFIAILLEIFLALWIRDSLFLNILMLIYPISAIKIWQTSI